MNTAEKLAHFVYELKYEDIPEDVIETSKKSILDNFAIILAAGAIGNGCAQMRSIAEAEGAYAQEATVIGFDEKLSELWAGFANGSMSHAVDFGDSYEKGTIHPTSSTFAAALAAAEARGSCKGSEPVSGKEFLTAMVAGCEVACRLSYGFTEDLAKYGWYMPPIITSFGATAAAAKIKGLAPQQIVNAFSFNLCETTCSSKILSTPDSVMRSIREGFSAKNAILACRLAAAGAKGFEDPFGGERGFFEAYGRTSVDEKRVTDGLGTVFETATVSFKTWPCCRGTHSPIDACLRLKQTYDIDPALIREIHLDIDSMNEMLMIPREEKIAPTNMISAKFSIPFAVSAALIDGGVDLTTFLEDNLDREDIRQLAEKFTYEVFPERNPMKAIVTITMEDGSTYKLLRDDPPGTRTNPVSYAEIGEKFRRCADVRTEKIAEAVQQEIIGTILGIEDLASIADLTSLL